MSQNPRVALDVETSRMYGRRILIGITQYIRSHRPWSIYVEQQELGSTPSDLLKRWRGDGLITRQTTPEFAKRLRRRRLAVVDLSDIHDSLGLTRIGSDHRSIGTLAAEHLLERGFRHFSCCGFSDQYWSCQRRDGFVAAIEKAGFRANVYQSQWEEHKAWEKELQRLCDWLKSLPKPVGVFATNDARGQNVLNACAREDTAVPEEVAVVGVDNDELLCGLASPPLSSIIPNPERIGYEAAQLLDELMSGQSPDRKSIEIPPIGVATRQSSDTLAIPDREVAAALRFIREHACEGTTVQAVLDRVPVSRSWLERYFRKYLNRSPQTEIRNVQIKRAKELLTATELSLEQIANLTGFNHPEYFSVVFKRETGETPGQFRRSVHG